MEQSDFRKFCTALEEHGIAFQYTIKPGQLEIYFDKLKKHPMADIQKALDYCYVSCKKFPTIACISEAYQAKRVNLNY